MYRVRFDTLSPTHRPDLPKVERPWVRPAWVVHEMIRTADADDTEWGRYFDCNRDGHLDSDERVTRRYFQTVSERDDSPKPVEFTVVERTIVLPPR